MMPGAFSQFTALGSSAVLLFAVAVLWRRGTGAYISAFKWQSVALGVLTAGVGYFGDDRELYGVAVMLVALKAVAIPRLLRRVASRFSHEHELDPYVNTATSLVVSGMLILLAYAVARPLQAFAGAPTRAAMPLALGLLFVSLFIVISRKKAITQVIGFLMLENAIALLAVLGTYGVPLIVELGVFLDALMGFLVMQIFLYDIHETFSTIDVDVLKRLRH
jgi:hydrogenase-4 component E